MALPTLYMPSNRKQTALSTVTSYFMTPEFLSLGILGVLLTVAPTPGGIILAIFGSISGHQRIKKEWETGLRPVHPPKFLNAGAVMGLMVGVALGVALPLAIPAVPGILALAGLPSGLLGMVAGGNIWKGMMEADYDKALGQDIEWKFQQLHDVNQAISHSVMHDHGYVISQKESERLAERLKKKVDLERSLHQKIKVEKKPAESFVDRIRHKDQQDPDQQIGR